jgi:hypothetical protein
MDSSNPYGKAKKNETASEKKTRQANYYRRQREIDTVKSEKGDSKASGELSKIRSKLSSKQRSTYSPEDPKKPQGVRAVNVEDDPVALAGFGLAGAARGLAGRALGRAAEEGGLKALGSAAKGESKALTGAKSGSKALSGSTKQRAVGGGGSKAKALTDNGPVAKPVSREAREAMQRKLKGSVPRLGSAKQRALTDSAPRC